MARHSASAAVKMLLRTLPVVVLVLGLPLLMGCARGAARPYARGPVTSRSAENGRERAAAAKRTPTRVPFVSFNVPNLHYIEDDWRFGSMLRYRLANEFEIHDAMQSVALMGGSVVRVYTLSVRKPTDTADVVRHVVGPNQFNEDAFVALDRVVATAAELGVQIILPFVDNWAYWGGVAEYAAFRHKPREAFFTDEQVIADFERTLDHVILRTNTVNGRPYSTDPTIYAWETGNELGGPDAWVARIAKYIKQRDPQHALIDGTYGPLIREQSLKDPNIDIVSSHHYGPVVRTLKLIDANLRTIGGRKRYFIGEFGLLTAADTERVLRHVLARPIEGVLLWSLRFHNRDGGYYHHLEKSPYQSLHFPGSLVGRDYDEQPIMQLMRHYAFSVRQQEVPLLPVPAAPNMLPVSTLGEVRWRGSVAARYYVVERQLSASRLWEVVGSPVDEGAVPYRPGFVDASAPIGEKVRYRVTAGNESGLSEPSVPTEEVQIMGHLVVDEMQKPQYLKSLEGPTEFTTQHAELCKMDRDRLRGRAGARVVYPIEGHATSLRLFAFAQHAGRVFELSWSANGRTFTKLADTERSFAGAVDEPVAFRPVLVSAESVPAVAREIAITWLQTAEIGRVEMQTLP